MYKNIITVLIALMFGIIATGANNVVKEITFDDWKRGAQYKSGEGLPDADLVLYGANREAALLEVKLRSAGNYYVEMLTKNTYLILYLRKGILSYDVNGNTSVDVKVYKAVVKEDGSWSNSGSQLSQNGIGASGRWSTVSFEIPEDGWYCLKSNSTNIYIDNIKNEITGFNLEGFVRDVEGVAVSGAAIAIDGEDLGVTNNDGYYFVGCEGKELCTLTVSCSGYETIEEQISIFADLSKDFTLTQKALTLNISLADEMGCRLSNATISIYGRELNNMGDGIYSADGLPAAKLGTGEWPLSVSLDDYIIFGDNNVCFDYDNRAVNLLAVKEHSYTITGKVINEWKTNVENAEVELLYDGEKIEESVFTNVNGEFTLSYTPVHFIPAEVSVMDFAAYSSHDSILVHSSDASSADVLMAPESDDAKNSGYRLRISQGSLYHPGDIEVPTPSAGDNLFALSEPVTMGSDSITVVEMTNADSIIINGKCHSIEPGSMVYNAQGIAVTLLTSHASVTLPAGIYFVAGQKIQVK